MSTNDKNFVDRMPHSIEAERAVIGCLLQNNEKIDEAFSILEPQMFYDPIFRAMFKSIDELWKNVKKDKDYKVDKVALKDKTIAKAMGYSLSDVVKNIRDRVKEEGFDADRLDDNFFGEILRATPITSNVLTYCNIVKEKYILRKSIELCENTIIDCRQGQKSAEDICNNAQSEFFRYGKSSTVRDYKELEPVVKEAINDAKEASKTTDGITGVRTGFSQIDRLTSGFQKGTMVVLAARTGEGKTAFALNLAYNMSKKTNKKVFYFSLEMQAKELVNRILAMESAIDGRKIKSGQLSEDEWSDFINAGRIVSTADIYVDDDPYLTISQLRNKCLKLKSEKGLDIVMIDYLGLMHAGKNQVMPRNEEIGEISRSIKALSKEIDIPILVLCQLNRDAEGKRPLLSEIRDSGAIEQDADIVILLHRPDKENEPDRTDLIFEKHRSGSTGVIQLRFDRNTTKFSEMDKTNIENK